MAELPQSQHSTAQAIIKWYEGKPQEQRDYLGISYLGHSCERHVWNQWRWVLPPSFPGRVLRMFDTGHRDEARVADELRGIGVQLWTVDPDTGQQWEVTGCDGHLAGHLDGVGKGFPEAPSTPAVWENKTHGNSSFNDLSKNGVRKSKPQHFDQMQAYMGLMKLDRALYTATNKDTDDTYSEWVHFDPDRFAVLMARAEKIVAASEPPAKLSDDPAYFECKWCNVHRHCHGGVAAEANCRTCCHSTPVEAGAWRCQFHNLPIDAAKQKEGCGDHLLIPALIPYATPVDGGEAWIAYRHLESGVGFTNSAGLIAGQGPSFTSRELHRCPDALVPAVVDAKETFPGSRVIDLLSDDPDKIPVKPASPATKRVNKRIAASVEALQKWGAT